ADLHGSILLVAVGDRPHKSLVGSLDHDLEPPSGPRAAQDYQPARPSSGRIRRLTVAKGLGNLDGGDAPPGHAVERVRVEPEGGRNVVPRHVSPGSSIRPMVRATASSAASTAWA